MAKQERDLTGVIFTLGEKDLKRGPSVPIRSTRAQELIPDSLKSVGEDGITRTYPSVVGKALEVIGNS